MHKETINIIIADDHTIFREGLKTVLKTVKHIYVAGDVGDGQSLIELALAIKPDVVLTDIYMPIADGVVATQQIKAGLPDTNIIALSMYDQDSMVAEMLQAGAIGYLLKNANKKSLVEAIETVANNTPYFCETITERLANMVNGKSPAQLKQVMPQYFSDREKAIIRMICQEKTNKEIAYLLGISRRTVESHRLRIMDKIGAKSIAGVITYALSHGIYQLDS
jgi:DNA-binding NarL/FixJ family response regulator